MTENKRTAKPPAALFATRGMTRFRCIADRCEDTCCQALQVPLNPGELERLRAALVRDPDGKALLKSAIVRQDADEENPAALARVGGRCAFLDTRNLCRILDRGHPYTVLPNTCITFPRKFGIISGHGVEVHATVACPEMARLELLVDDALELVPAGPEVSGVYSEEPRGAEPSPYAAPLLQVRAWGVARLLDETLPLAARLLTFTELGQRVDAFFRRDAWAEEPGRLEEALLAVESPAVREKLKAAAAEPASTSAVGAILNAAGTVFLSKLGGPSGRLDRLLPPAVERWGGRDAPLEVLAQGYRAAARALPPRAELILSRYCAGDWQKSWYTAFPTVSERGLGLLARACSVNVMLAAHPTLGDPAADGAAVDAALVEAVQVAAKNFELSAKALPEFLAVLRREIPDPLEQALAMARFCARA